MDAYNAAAVIVALFHVSEMKQYCSTLLPYVSEQPVKTEQLPAAMLEANTLCCARAHGDEVEWSRQPPAAKRSRQVGRLVHSSRSLVFLHQSVLSSLWINKNFSVLFYICEHGAKVLFLK